MRSSIGLVATLVLASAAFAAGPAMPECDGRYDVGGGGTARAGLGTRPRMRLLAGDAVEIDGWCRLEGLKRKVVGKKGVRLRRRFRSCGTLGSGRFDAMLSKGCQAISGMVKVKKVRGRLY